MRLFKFIGISRAPSPARGTGEEKGTSPAQSQTSTDGSVAIQAGNDVVVNQGLTYTEARSAALDVFRANFYELAGIARDIASQRASELTEQFLTKLQLDNPDALKRASSPDFQAALFTAQKEYAISGDEDLASVLVDLLVARSEQQQRNMLQIVQSP